MDCYSHMWSMLWIAIVTCGACLWIAIVTCGACLWIAIVTCGACLWIAIVTCGACLCMDYYSHMSSHVVHMQSSESTLT